MWQDDTNEPIAVFSSDLGWMAARWDGPLLARLSFGHGSPQAAIRSLGSGSAVARDPGRRQERLIGRLRRFAAGEADDFADVQIDESRYTPFQCRVVRQCRRIPYGDTVSYAELAARAGSPAAARAVGNVMAANRFPLVVPCHRVVGSGGALGGFSAPHGLKLKRRLLKLEATGEVALAEA